MTSSLPSAPGGRLNVTRALGAQALREVQVVLRMWPTIKHELADYEADAVHGGYCTDFEARGKTSRVSNPTMSRALRLATDPRVRALRRIDQAIERALVQAGGNTAPIVQAMRLHHLRGRSWGEIATALTVSRATTLLWQRRFRVLVWEQLRGRRVA